MKIFISLFFILSLFGCSSNQIDHKKIYNEKIELLKKSNFDVPSMAYDLDNDIPINESIEF